MALTAINDSTSLTVLGTELTRAGGRYVVCGRVSEFPARLAVGVRGAPDALTDIESAGLATEGGDSLPNTGGGLSLSSDVAWFGVLAGFALVVLAVSAAFSSRRHRR